MREGQPIHVNHLAAFPNILRYNPFRLNVPRGSVLVQDDGALPLRERARKQHARALTAVQPRVAFPEQRVVPPRGRSNNFVRGRVFSGLHDALQLEAAHPRYCCCCRLHPWPTQAQAKTDRANFTSQSPSQSAR